MKPHQIITLMNVDGADNAFALPDHFDHIHIGWRPLDAPGAAAELAGVPTVAAMSPKQWLKLFDRLRDLPAPWGHEVP